MGKVQTNFLKFHDNIKLDNFDENQALRDKRDMLIEELESLKSEDLPDGSGKFSFETKNQGSYSTFTGIKPLNDSDYDIDVALIFDFNKNIYEDPTKLKVKIHDVLNSVYKRTVKIKEPCVTVEYPKFHVDLPCYAKNESGDLYLARGKEFSDAENKKWEQADPEGLKDYINNTITTGNQRDQFRRVVKYIKLWKNKKITDFSVPSIGLTIFTIKNFQYSEDNDLGALANVLSLMVLNFKVSCSVSLPVAPNTDTFAKLTESQKKSFIEKLEKFSEQIKSIESLTSELDAISQLNKIFGDDFPCENNPQKTARPYTSSGSHA
ncbi:MAG: nucleotidyltransferase [Neisseriaceae bacterium]|nr:MAG: nucleotidyltransferase [Neisseriaceae bacterium]